MAYIDYTLSEIEQKYDIAIQRKKLFQQIILLNDISDWLRYTLDTAEELPTKSEKAKSELIVMPILIEMRRKNAKYFTIYSGDMLNIDDKLRGECDFILSKDTSSFDINAPILQMVEAKKHDVELGIAQCAAQMVGAQKYNQKKAITPSALVYGCVTTGDDWLFMKLEANTIQIDTKKYYLGNLPELLGVFQIIIDYFKKQDSQ
jgi:hypothetical protein